MRLSHPIQLRINAEKRFIYEAEAHVRGLSLSTYLRERLEKMDAVCDEIIALRDVIQTRSYSTMEQSPSPQLLEILYLLRSLAGADRVKMVQAEMARLAHQKDPSLS